MYDLQTNDEWEIVSKIDCDDGAFYRVEDVFFDSFLLIYVLLWVNAASKNGTSCRYKNTG